MTAQLTAVGKLSTRPTMFKGVCAAEMVVECPEYPEDSPLLLLDLAAGGDLAGLLAQHGAGEPIAVLGALTLSHDDEGGIKHHMAVERITSVRLDDAD